MNKRARIYSVSFTDVAVTADQDLFQLEAVTNDVIIHACYISQNSDVADAAAENLTIRVVRFTDALTNVTAEVNLDEDNGPALADLNVNDTTPLVTGAETIHVEVWNIAMPWIYLPPPELRPICPDGEGIAINLVANPADSLTMSGTLYFEET